MSKPVDIGSLRIAFKGKSRISAESIISAKHTIETTKYELTHNKAGWSIILGYMPFPDAKDIRCLEYSNTAPDGLHRLCHGLRMAIYYNETINWEWVELSQARLKQGISPDWSNLFKASEGELNRGSGLDVRSLMMNLGASFGERASVLGDKGKRRSYYCAAFPVDNQIVPLVAYAATRVLPLMRRCQ